jgi:hypothetical protein
MAKRPATKKSKTTKKSVGFDYGASESSTTKIEADMHICATWKAELKRAHDVQKPWYSDGEEVKRFIEGSQWNPGDDIGGPNASYMKTTNNRLWPLFQGYLSNLIYQRPNVTAKAVRKGDEALQRAKVNSKVMNYVLRETHYETETRLAISDALIYGCGAKEQRINREKGDIATSEWVSIKDILVDPDANTNIRTVGWVAKKFTMRLTTARKLYAKAISKEIGPLTASSGMEEQEKPGSTGKPSEQKGVAGDSITLYRIYLRGDDPVAEDTSEENEPNKSTLPEGDEKDTHKSALQKHLEGSGNKVITIALGYPVILDERPWPYVLDNDEFPITFYRVHLYPGKFLPHSPFKPLLPLQKSMNWATTFAITQMRTMSQIKFVVDKSQMSGVADEEIEKLVSLDDREVIITNGRMADAVQRVDFGTISQHPLQMLPLMQQQFDDISGFQELFGGMRGARSATEADIREQRAQTNSALMLQAVESSMNEDVRHMLQIMFSVTPLKKIEKIVGPEELYVFDDAGEPTASFWQIGMPVEDIRCEVDILLEPGSTRRVNRDQEVNDRINLLDRKTGLLKMLTEMMAAGLVKDQNGLASILNFINKDLEDIADKLGWTDADRAKLPPEAFNLVPPPTSESQTFNVKHGDTTIKLGDNSYEDARTMPGADPTLQLDLSQNPSTSTTTKSGGAA